MQKLMKRTAQAEKQVRRRVAKQARYQQAEERGQRFREQRQQLDELNHDIKVSRLARREKWDLGPVAPRRDIFDNWGAIETNRQGRQSALKPEEVEARCAWAGGRKYLNLAVKDRVVLLEGPEKGKIDRIASINKEHGTVTLENIAKITSSVPEAFQEAMEAPPTQNAAMNIPISAIRLVHPIVDPKTGTARDVVVRAIARSPVKWDRHSGWHSWTRYIPGENIAIPWPEREKAVREDTPADTKLIDVEAQTFVPTLLRPPMPESVIDELRNKYSRFRTRHEAEYIQRKEDEESLKKALKRMSADTVASVRTPLQEFNRQQRDARRARGKPEMSDDMLEKIGEVIARNKARTLNGAGLSEVSSTPTPQILDSAVPSTEAPKESQPPPQ